MGAVLMVQGTSSDAGKSILCAALCRYFSDQGYRVAPFKAQNMALNAMAVDCGEIGWAQVMQAEAARTAPSVEMNPVLLKPVSDTDCQVVVLGTAVGNMSASEYLVYKKEAFSRVLQSLDGLRRRFDLVVMEGAGSPAEANLREHDIVNMGLAEAADAPVLLVSDIDRGGMFAYVAGTLALLSEQDRRRVRGVVVNRFRGEPERLRPGLAMLEQRTGTPVVGVIPYLKELSLPPEDSLGLVSGSASTAGLDVAVVRLPRVANFTDFHVLADEDGVQLRYVASAGEFGEPHVVILPGTKNTLSDLRWLRENGLAEAVTAAYRRGAFVVGVCGGFQMLGQTVRDPQGLDGAGGDAPGLGLLPVDTDFLPEKTVMRVRGRTVHDGVPLQGYEIHLGRTVRRAGRAFALLEADEGGLYEDGACDTSGRMFGTYLHGLFDSPHFRRRFLNCVREAFRLPGATVSGETAREKRERSYRLLSETIQTSVQTEFLLELIRQQNRRVK